MSGETCCGGGSCGPSRNLDRRRFLAGSGSALFALSGLRGFAGPFGLEDGFPIPADKKLDPAWVESLFARGAPEVVEGEALRFIGMPVGGFFAGTVYLGGDGRLWNWDVFDERHEGTVARAGVAYRGQPLRERDGANYASPPEQQRPFELDVALVAAGARRALDRTGWPEVRFRGTWPVGTVEYSDAAAPLAVRLEAFSPFVPLDVESSSFPATVLRYTLTNAGEAEAEVELVASFENPVLHQSRPPGWELRAEDASTEGNAAVFCSAAERTMPDSAARPDVVLEDFESGTYDGWEVAGTAFGDRPRHVDDIADYQGDLNAEGERLVNSHETRHGEDVRAGDAHVGTLTSRPFRLARRYVGFRIGGGAHAGRTCLNLIVDGQVVRSATGRDENRMHRASFDVSELEGREARLQVVDAERGGWGNVGVDEIVLTDAPRPEVEPKGLGDFGTFCVSCRGAGGFARPAGSADGRSEVGRRLVLPAQGSATVTLVVAWHFPNVQVPGLPGRRWYAGRWADALHVARELEERLDELRALTFAWRDTWYDSTLPYWLLDRTLIPLGALATSTCQRLEDGRYWFWEGVGCCAGTCTHVWGYAQAIGRLFPEVERDLRERIDYGLAFHADSGAIDYRAEHGRHVAHDGQCGCVLRAYREHLVSPDGAFLARVWPRVKRSLEHLIAEDGDADGLLEGAQYNTLDAAWYGPMAWLSSLYVAALRAGAAMARARGEGEFAERCDALAARGSVGLVDELFDGEYFVHRPDPEHPEANATGDGCHIDQLYGQAWAHQVGLGRIVPTAEARSALRALWTYNFAPDVGVYRDRMKAIQGGRWYALHGEAGLVMCTFPHGGAERATGAGQSAWAAMYMNECMTGFEHQAAAHMIWEGLVLEGLAVERAIHDRYAPARRNPYNEIECSDHYGRAMAAYGVYVAACGFGYDGPRGWMSVAPRVGPDDFRAAFTAAEGWGTLSVKREPGGQRCSIALRHGRLALEQLALEPGFTAQAAVVELVRADGTREELAATARPDGAGVRVELAGRVLIAAGERLEVALRA